MWPLTPAAVDLLVISAHGQVAQLLQKQALSIMTNAMRRSPFKNRQPKYGRVHLGSGSPNLSWSVESHADEVGPS